MRFLILFILSLFSVSAFAGCPQFFYGGQPPTTVVDATICHDKYAIGFSYVMKEAQYSAEYLTSGDTPTRKEGWHVEHSLPSKYRMSYSDYTGTGFDRCHLAASADFHSAEAMRATYSMANMLPCTGTLNQGVWSDIESRTRAMRPAYVVTGGLWSGAAKITTKSGAELTVPSSEYKAVTTANSTCVYVAPNDDSGSYRLLSLGEFIDEYGFNPVPASSLPCDKASFKLTGE